MTKQVSNVEDLVNLIMHIMLIRVILYKTGLVFILQRIEQQLDKVCQLEIQEYLELQPVNWL